MGVNLSITMTQDWKEKIYHIIIHNGTSEEHLKLVALVESLLKEERLAVLSEVEREAKQTKTKEFSDQVLTITNNLRIK